MSPRRSAEETEMRALVETWGRSRWPGARCVHELVISECRIDMAFIGETHMVAGVCRELRARGEGRMGQAFVRADPAIRLPPTAVNGSLAL